MAHSCRVLLAAVALAASMGRAVADEPDPAASAAGLYASMSARDLPGVLRYVPAEGFTEVGPDATTPRVLAPAAFEALFGSGLVIALRAEDLRVQRFGDAAIVTGVRVGVVGPKGSSSAGERVPFTMVWIREPGGWRLRHVHLSAPTQRTQ